MPPRFSFCILKRGWPIKASYLHKAWKLRIVQANASINIPNWQRPGTSRPFVCTERAFHLNMPGSVSHNGSWLLSIPLQRRAQIAALILWWCTVYNFLVALYPETRKFCLNLHSYSFLKPVLRMINNAYINYYLNIFEDSVGRQILRNTPVWLSLCAIARSINIQWN